MPLQTPLKTQWKKLRRNHMAYVCTCIYIVSLKTFYEKPWEKLIDVKGISVIRRLSTSYN
jgi:hypothetical protein